MTTLHSRRKRRELARERLQMASKGLLQPGSPNARRKSTVSLSLTMAEVDEMVAAAEAEQPMSAGLEPRPGGLDLLLNQLHTLTIVFTKLAFPVPYLFAAGSPIATFLTMRGASAQPTDPCHGPHLLPPNTRVFNIFHSVDPLAYRLEPLIFSSERQPAVPVGPWPPKAPSLLSTTLALESVSKAADSLLSKLTSSLRSSNSSKPDDATVVEVVGSKDNGNGSAVALASSVAASASATPSPPPLDSSSASDGLFSRLKSSLRTSAPKSENVGPATKVAATATAAVAATAMPGAEAAENVEPTNKDEFEAMVPPGTLKKRTSGSSKCSVYPLFTTSLVGRLDFVLDESVAKSAQPMQYMRLTTSHTHYFYRFDILYFITQVLIHHTPGAEMPAEPETTAPPKEAPSKDVDGTIDPV